MSRECRLTTCLGLGAAASPEGLVCDPDTGRYELAGAVNVEVAGGRIRRRPGLVRLAEKGFADLFSDGPNLYGVGEGGLWLVPGQGEPRLLRDGLTRGARMAFAAVGGTVYFANGFETGKIRDGAALPWSAAAYPGPDRSGRYVPPPAGHLLAVFAGRVWIACHDLVRFTEGAGLCDWVDSLAGFLPPATGRVRMLRSVSAGLLIGDDAGVVLAAGTDPAAMTFARVCPVPPLAGSDVSLPAGRHGTVAGRETGGDAALWAAGDGLYCGLASGRVVRLASVAIPPGVAAGVSSRDRYRLYLTD